MAITSPKRRSRRGRAPMAEINVTPLVDVMLVLLIIFMVTAPLLTAGVPLELPDSSARPLDQKPRQIDLSITPDGTVYIDKQPVEPGLLAARISALPCAGDARQQVNLRADRVLEYGKVMEVMGELNRAGCNTISLVTNSSVSAP
jgi:biopolymer transport protein TolR